MNKIDKNMFVVIEQTDVYTPATLAKIQGGVSLELADCSCGEGNSNSSGDCSCGSGNSNKKQPSQDCSCGSGNNNKASATNLLVFG